MGLRAFVISLLFLSVQLTVGQVGGRTTYQFLNIVSSPIQDALGGKLATSSGDDVNQTLINPSIMDTLMDGRLGLNYGNYFTDINFGTVAYGFSVGKNNRKLVAGVTYMSYGDFEGVDEFQNRTGNFTGKDVAVSLGHGFNLPVEYLQAGVNLKLITSTLESYSSFGAAIDVSVTYKRPDKTLYTLVLRNIGTQFTSYDEVKEPLPFDILIGISKKLEHAPIRWHITLQDLQRWKSSYSNTAVTYDSPAFEETNFLDDVLHHINIGAEIFPDRKITLRVGYNFRRSYELSTPNDKTFSGLATGVGIRLKRFRFDYSYSRYTSAGNTSLFGLQFTL